MAGIRLEGSVSGNVAEVTPQNALRVALPDASLPGAVGAVRMLTQNDAGEALGAPVLGAPEADEDNRLRIASEAVFDVETFNYTAQNTGKHLYRTTTLAFAWSAAGLTTNSGNITTTATGAAFQTYAEFPILGASHLYCEVCGSFSAAPTTNTIIDFGLMRLAAANPFAPSDGVHFRLTSAGLFGVLNSNGTETLVGPFTFPYVLNRKYQFIASVHERSVAFWIDGVLHGRVDTPVGQGQPCMSSSLPFSVRHAIVGGAAGSAISFVLNDYNVAIGGPNIAQTASIIGNRVYGSYQGLSGGAMGSLATLPNSTNPTAGTPTNTALVANLPAGLGGQGAVNAQAAAATDLIFASYQVPVATPNVQGRRLVVRGVEVDLVNLGAAVATTATTIQFALAYGHTAVSMATAEAAAAKAPRRIALGFATWPIGAAIGAQPQAGKISVDLGDAPIFVNPGEFIALVGKFLVGTATASQVINFTWQPIYGWE